MRKSKGRVTSPFPSFTQKGIEKAADEISTIAQGMYNSHCASCPKCLACKKCKIADTLVSVAESTARVFYVFEQEAKKKKLASKKTRKPRR